MQNTGFFLAAFIIAWAVVFGYVLVLLNKQKKLRQEVEALRQALEEKKSST